MFCLIYLYIQVYPQLKGFCENERLSINYSNFAAAGDSDRFEWNPAEPND